MGRFESDSPCREEHHDGTSGLALFLGCDAVGHGMASMESSEPICFSRAA